MYFTIEVLIPLSLDWLLKLLAQLYCLRCVWVVVVWWKPWNKQPLKSSLKIDFIVWISQGIKEYLCSSPIFFLSFFCPFSFLLFFPLLVYCAFLEVRLIFQNEWILVFSQIFDHCGSIKITHNSGLFILKMSPILVQEGNWFPLF